MAIDYAKKYQKFIDEELAACSATEWMAAGAGQVRYGEGKEVEIYGADGAKQGEYPGYTTVVRRSVVVAKVSDDQQELLRVQAQLEEAQAKNEALEQENANLLYENLTGEVPA
jgi:hypothetical protein